MSNFICKIATKEEILKELDYEISIHPYDNNWLKWKEEAARRKDGERITYIGVLDGKIITEATAALTKESCQNSDNLVDEDTVYLMAFRTKKDYRGQGYFSRLFNYMINDLKNRNYKKVTIGVEPSELTNREIYSHYGFNDFIKKDFEIEPDGSKVEVDYYGKYL